jgi:hypothetical protein
MNRSTSLAALFAAQLLATGCAFDTGSESAGKASFDSSAGDDPTASAATPPTGTPATAESCPVTGHEELEILSCLMFDAEAGRFAVVEEGYADLAQATIYAELDGDFVPVHSSPSYGPSADLVSATITSYDADGVPAVVIALDDALGARAFQVVAWDATSEPTVVASFDALDHAHAVAVADGLRVVAVLEEGHEAHTLVRTAPGAWTVEDHGIVEVGAATPALASETLLMAWHDSSPSAALEVASQEVVDQLLSKGPGAAWSFAGCELLDDSSKGESEATHVCGYGFEGGFAHLFIDEPVIGGFSVVGVGLVAD